MTRKSDAGTVWIYAIPVVLMCICVCFRSKDNVLKQYIVTDKGANKIVYRPIDDTRTKYVMNFDGDTIDPRGGFYKYIRLGDTITGPARFMSQPLSKSWCYQGMRPPTPVPTIHTVQGRTLREWRKISERDSVINEMRQRQR